MIRTAVAALMLFFTASQLALGAKTPARESVSESRLRALVVADLKQHAPFLRVLLQTRLLGATPPYYSDLERAGLLKRVKGLWGDPCAGGAAFDLTPRGLAEARARHWEVYSTTLMIPVGKYRFISLRATAGSLIARYRFASNGNAKYLLHLGKAADWVLDGYENPPATLEEADRIVNKMLVIGKSGSSWVVGEREMYRLPPCGF